MRTAFPEERSTDEMARWAVETINRSGLTILSKSYENPWFPDGFSPDSLDCWTSSGQHRCEDSPVIVLPIIWVWDVKVYDQQQNRCVKAQSAFPPYCAGEALVVHGTREPPSEDFRPASVIEAACAIAQYPEVGSLRARDPQWPSECGAQAFFCGDTVNLRSDGSNGDHHVLWIREREHPADAFCRQLNFQHMSY